MNTIYAPNLQKHITGSEISPTKRGLDVVVNGTGGGALPIYIGALPYNADFVGTTRPSATQVVYDFKQGGSGGTIVATVIVDFLDALKDEILNVTVSI